MVRMIKPICGWAGGPLTVTWDISVAPDGGCHTVLCRCSGAPVVGVNVLIRVPWNLEQS